MEIKFTSQILDAAIICFARGGMRAASMREIAREADVSPARLQRVFGTKANLWEAALKRSAVRDLCRLRRFFQNMHRLDAGRSLTRDEKIALLRAHVEDIAEEAMDIRIVWYASLIDNLRQESHAETMARWLACKERVWRKIASTLGLPSGTSGTLLLGLSAAEIMLFGIQGPAERSLYTEAFVRFIFLGLQGIQACTGEWFSSWCRQHSYAHLEPGQEHRPQAGGPDAARWAIGNATADLLLAHGPEGVTHRKIAREAGLPLATTTHYFTGLNDLLLAGYTCLSTRMLRTVGSPDDLPASTAPEELAAAVVYTWLSADAGRGRALAGLLEVHIAAARETTLAPLVAANIADLTVLAYRFLRNTSAYNIKSIFAAHMHFALSLSAILFAAIQGQTSLAERAAEDLATIGKQLFR